MTELIGYIAMILTTAAFFPQAWKTIKTKDTSGISLMMYFLFFLGVVLWFVYGILISSGPLIIGNLITAVNAMIILYYKYTEDKRKIASQL